MLIGWSLFRPYIYEQNIGREINYLWRRCLPYIRCWYGHFWLRMIEENIMMDCIIMLLWVLYNNLNFIEMWIEIEIFIFMCVWLGYPLFLHIFHPFMDIFQSFLDIFIFFYTHLSFKFYLNSISIKLYTCNW